MTAVTQRIKGFLSSPQGRGLMDRGRRWGRKPTVQQRMRQFAERIRGRSGRRR